MVTVRRSVLANDRRDSAFSKQDGLRQVYAPRPGNRRSRSTTSVPAGAT